MLQHQQADGDEGEYEHYGMNFFPTANDEIKTNMRNESPEYSLGYREGKGDQDYSQKSRETLFNFREIDVVDASEHRRAYQNQDRRCRIHGNHARERSQKEAGQETEGREH